MRGPGSWRKFKIIFWFFNKDYSRQLKLIYISPDFQEKAIESDSKDRKIRPEAGIQKIFEVSFGSKVLVTEIWFFHKSGPIKDEKFKKEFSFRLQIYRFDQKNSSWKKNILLWNLNLPSLWFKIIWSFSFSFSKFQDPHWENSMRNSKEETHQYF